MTRRATAARRTVQSGSPFEDGEPVWALRADGPKHGEDIWDLTNLITRTSQAERRINLIDIPSGYRPDVVTILGILAQPDHPAVIAAGVVARGGSRPTSSIAHTYSRFKIIAEWGTGRSLTSLAQWTQAEADAFLDALREGTYRTDNDDGVAASTIRTFVTTLRLGRNFAPALSNPLPFLPWGGRSASDIGGERRAAENSTPPLPWETWAPLVAAAWAFISVYAADIIRANEAKRTLIPEPRGPRGWETFRQWHANGGTLPLSTGFGRTSPRGAPLTRVLCRTLHVNDNFLNPAHNMFQPQAALLIEQMAADPQRSVIGGLVVPTAKVTHPDNTVTPWIEEYGLGEHEYLISALRAACYVIIASLTGMRDSEIQDMTRDTLTEADGLTALSSIQTKGRVRNARGQRRTWWAPKPVITAVEVLQQITPHTTHLFARSAANPPGAYDPSRDIRRLIAFVNDAPATRAGRGAGLALAPIAEVDDSAVHATSLRRSFSVYAVTKPGAELGLGIQLGHSAWRLTSGYAADGSQRAVVHMNETRRAILREQAVTLITGTTPLAGAPARDINNFRARIITNPEQAARLAEQVADRLHLGLTNDCMFNPSTSGCGPDGPHLADHHCIGEDCANALYRPEHAHVITDTIARIDLSLDQPRGNPDLMDSMRRNRANLARIRRQLQTQEDDD